MKKDNVVIDYYAYRACDIADIERKAIARYKKKEHDERNRRARERNAIRREQERTKKYYLDQRLIAFVLFCIMAVSTIFVDLIFSLGMIFSVWAMFTKKMIIVNDYWEDHGGMEQWNSRGLARNKNKKGEE